MPPLVISKIHYHPMDWWGIDGDHLEFVEISNNGDETVDLTGVYFRELGLTYQFPDGATLAGHEALVLCSDSLIFSEYYGTTPFGHYSRNLSNQSENLVLADAWGNVIDEVCYSDSLPWPMEADGNGPFLQLKNLDFDNSLAENWMLGYELTGVKAYAENAAFLLFPNPTVGAVHVVTTEQADRCQVFDLMGNLLHEAVPTSLTIDMDLSRLPSGMYLIKVQMANGEIGWQKVIKQ